MKVGIPTINEPIAVEARLGAKKKRTLPALPP
jgi:hypothetical protein